MLFPPIGPPPTRSTDLALPRGSRDDCGTPSSPTVIRGQVLDSLTGAPVDTASIYVGSGYATCRLYTDEAGRFEVTAMDSGSYTIRATKSRYRAAAIESSLGPTDTLEFLLSLAPRVPCDPIANPGLPRVETMDSTVVLRTPPAMTSALEQVAPGFTPLPLNHFADWIVGGYSLACYQAPSAVVGDFNDDGVLDLVTYGYSDLGEQSFLLLSNSEGFEYIERPFPQPLGGTGGHDTRLIRAEPFTPFNYVYGDGLELTTPGFWEVYEEKGSTLFYVVEGQLRDYIAH
jgi:hypothetical protein